MIKKSVNQTKIIATLGPSSSTPETIRDLVRAGASCFRLNFSHGDGEAFTPLIESIREIASEESAHIPILADIQGPKLRIGKVPDEGVTLHEGSVFTLSHRAVLGTDREVQSQYDQLATDVHEGTRILLADGSIELSVVDVRDGEVHCLVVTGGRLYSNKGINIPRTKLSVATLTEKDHRDLRFCAKAGIDVVAISFVRSAQDIHDARGSLGSAKIPVLAKLELPEVLEHLDEVLHHSDGVMVARGDLGVEMDFEEVPTLQKRILRRASERGKFAMVATQMLGSMTLNRRPSRAEVSDVANAVLDGADATMLSEETAAGKHPVEAVQAMVRINREAETLQKHTNFDVEGDIVNFATAAAGAAVSAAARLNAKAVVALAGSGLTALALSKARPTIPIIALSINDHTLRRLNMLFGVRPVGLPNKSDLEDQLHVADDYLKKNHLAKPGDTIVAVAAIPLGEGRPTNTIRLHHVRE